MVRKFYPLRPIQRWLVDTHFNKAKSTMMNIGGLFKLAAAIDMERLATAINQVITTHDVFSCRLVFHPQTSELCQIFNEEIDLVRVEHLTNEEFQARLEKLREPYYLIYEPLFRIYLIETPSAKYLYVDFYHAIMDGVSAAYLFWHEINRAYRGRKSKREPLSYAAYVEEEANVPKEKLEAGHDYWRKILAPFDEKKHLPPVNVEGVAAWTQGNFDYTFRDFKQDFFIDSGLNENTFFLGACMLTLAKITGSNEAIMSWIHNGRTKPSEYRIMGLMLEQFPCAFDFHEDITIGEFLDKLTEQIKTGMKYRKSLEVVYDEGLEDDCVSFIFQKAMHGNLLLDDTPAQVVYLPPNEISAVENALDIEINAEDKDAYNLFLDYDASRYSESDMNNFALTLEKILLDMRDTKRLISGILG